MAARGSRLVWRVYQMLKIATLSRRERLASIEAINIVALELHDFLFDCRKISREGKHGRDERAQEGEGKRERGRATFSRLRSWLGRFEINLSNTPEKETEKKNSRRHTQGVRAIGIAIYNRSFPINLDIV